MNYIYDIETYPNIFTFGIIREDGKHEKVFEISDRVNQIDGLFKCFYYLINNKISLVGFNNLNFDYPIIHQLIKSEKDLMKMSGEKVCSTIYQWVQTQIDSMKDGFASTIQESDHYIRQLDLFKISHFDNKAKMTSLKQIEFNMRMLNIQELPFAVGTSLTDEEKDILIEYNKHDLKATKEFYLECLSGIKLRESLTEKYGIDFTNFNDTKIGKSYFENLLKNSGIKTHKKVGNRNVCIQTKRPFIKIGDCLFDYYNFENPAFELIRKWFSKQVISETKGVFSDIEEHRLGDVANYAEMVTKRIKFKDKPTEKDLSQFLKEHPKGWIEEVKLSTMEIVRDTDGNIIKEEYVDKNGKVKKRSVKRNKISYQGCYRIAETLNVVVNGFRYDYGVGGIHGSDSGVFLEDDTYCIVDADVASMYPNLAISNSVYPEHLGIKFCEIYKDVYEQRKSFPKGSPENAALKLALNGVYGDSNSEFSVFYDSKYTMSITINGQLSLSMLAERLLTIDNLSVIQINTDGVTVKLPRNKREEYDSICKQWQKDVKLDLEFAEYSKMFIRDVNNYLAVYTNGKLKNKGAFEYKDLPHNKDQSMLIVPKAVESHLVHGKNVEEFIRSHDDVFDFMLRVKVPKSSELYLEMFDGSVEKQQNICRYYVSKDGGKLVKVMPALEGKDEDRRMMIQAEYLCTPCNFIESIDNIKNINYNFYINEAHKLVDAIK